MERAYHEVLYSLVDLFPQIDKRLLKAVAIEHNKDVDAAVVAVLEDVIPFYNVRSSPNSPLDQSVNGGESSEGSLPVRTEVETRDHNDHSVVSGNSKPSSSADDGLSESFHDANAKHHEREDDNAELVLSVETLDKGVEMNANIHSPGESLVVVAVGENKVVTDQLEVLGDPETERTDSARETLESSVETSCGSNAQPAAGMPQDVEMGVGEKTDSIQEKEDDIDGTAHDVSASTSLVEAPDMHESNLENSNLTSSTDNASIGKNISSTPDTEDVSTSNASMCSQSHIIDVMEELIAEARNNKKNLFSEMESVVKLMKQVEVEEQAAARAKTEVASGGIDLLNQAEELKKMLQHAKEANDMHAGEVYGEKAILATELRELQSRVRSLSDERDKSLADLAEMRQGLEVRLAAAVSEIKSAELETNGKIEVARKSLAEQELIMEKVVQESKALKQQADDNAKLQEFLVDRGRVVDTLQGEIAVICQDVKHLKEKFDQHAPLGRSLFSSQTSFLLASSTSSLKSLVPDHVETVMAIDDDLLETENNRDHKKVSTDEKAKDHKKFSEDKPASELKKVVDDEEWEIFDSSEAKA